MFPGPMIPEVRHHCLINAKESTSRFLAHGAFERIALAGGFIRQLRFVVCCPSGALLPRHVITLGLSSLGITVSNVVEGRAFEQMSWVDAWGVVASV